MLLSSATNKIEHMDSTLIFLDPDSQLGLQAQIRQKLVEAINSGIFPLGRRLPSSRKLAEQLGVARNTVVLAYEQLIDEGYLISRERSGITTPIPSSMENLIPPCSRSRSGASLPGSHWGLGRSMNGRVKPGMQTTPC